MDNALLLVIALIIVAYIVTTIISELPTSKTKAELTRKDNELSCKIRELKKLEDSIDIKQFELQEAQNRNINSIIDSELNYQRNLLSSKEDYLNKELSELREFKKKTLQEYQKQKSDIQKIAEENSQKYPWLAELYADYFKTTEYDLAEYFRTKPYPAEKAAETIKRISREKREITVQCKMLEYQLSVYENLHPQLEEFKEFSVEDIRDYAKLITSDDNEYSILKNWLSPEEYEKLPTVQKYQLALDRYNTRQKSKWQVGIDYERFIGYQYEQQGYKVKYNGALKGLKDMGRDLIATKDNTILIIQCKRWAKEKNIHENHIFQLYGTTVYAKIDNPDKNIRGVFITTAQLSPVARYCAKTLQIEVIENKSLESYPQIKCNISRNKEKIYHLPFDQQYDTTIINPVDGDFYAATVQEAEDAGFRRAWRWHSSS